jgi:hypothetical protein
MAITRTPITNNPGALQVKRASGEFLHFTLTVGGPLPIFSFNSSVKGTLFEAPDFMGHPKSMYEWEHLKNPSDMQALELLDLHMAFITNQNYGYKVEKRAADGTVVATILEVNFTGDPTDHTAESFLLLVS